PPVPTLMPYTTLFRSRADVGRLHQRTQPVDGCGELAFVVDAHHAAAAGQGDRLQDARKRIAECWLMIAEGYRNEARHWKSGVARSEEHTSELQSRSDL